MISIQIESKKYSLVGLNYSNVEGAETMSLSLKVEVDVPFGVETYNTELRVSQENKSAVLQLLTASFEGLVAQAIIDQKL